MLGDLMGNFQEKQAAMKERLASITIEEKIEGLTITANAAREILNINIEPSLLEDKEQLEDLLVVTLNKVMDKVAEKEAEMSQNMVNDLLPPGMAGLFGA